MQTPVKVPVMPGRGAIGPYLDVNVESEAWLKTWAEYVMRVNLLPADALERKAVRLRMKLVQDFKAVRLQKGQAKREMKARGGRIKIRKSIRDQYKSGTFLTGSHGLGALLNRKSKARIAVEKTIKKTGARRTVQRFAWKDAVEKELGARQRSRALLAGSWVNKLHTYKVSELPYNLRAAGRVAHFRQQLKSNRMGSSVDINTVGNNPRIVLQNFIEGVSKVGASKGIIARVLRAETDDMKTYLARKAERAAKALQGGGK